MVKHKIIPMPDATVGEVLGLVEITYSFGGMVKISFLADELRMEIDELGDVVDMCEMLEVVKVDEGTVVLTLYGEGLSLGTTDNKKKIIRERIKKVEPFKTVMTLIEKAGGEIAENDLFDELSSRFMIEDMERFRKLLIGWGNYTETFEFDGEEGVFRL